MATSLGEGKPRIPTPGKKIDLVSHPARTEGLVNIPHIYIYVYSLINTLFEKYFFIAQKVPDTGHGDRTKINVFSHLFITVLFRLVSST